MTGGLPTTQEERVKKTEVGSGRRASLPSDVAGKMKALERENSELRQANEILRKASACFTTAELDRLSKRCFRSSTNIVARSGSTRDN
jgi:transposase